MKTLLRLTCLVLSATYFVDGVIASTTQKSTADRRRELKNRHNQVWTDSRVGLPGYKPAEKQVLKQSQSPYEPQGGTVIDATKITDKQTAALKKMITDGNPTAEDIIKELNERNINEIKGKDFDLQIIRDNTRFMAAVLKPKKKQDLSDSTTDPAQLKEYVDGIMKGDF